MPISIAKQQSLAVKQRQRRVFSQVRDRDQPVSFAVPAEVVMNLRKVVPQRHQVRMYIDRLPCFVPAIGLLAGEGSSGQALPRLDGGRAQLAARRIFHQKALATLAD